jgi:hypothetical protein
MCSRVGHRVVRRGGSGFTHRHPRALDSAWGHCWVVTVARLFTENPTLYAFLDAARRRVVAYVDRFTDDDLLSRSDDSLVAELMEKGKIEPLVVETTPYDGDTLDTTIDVPSMWRAGERSERQATRVMAWYRYTGDRELFRYQPSTSYTVASMAEVGAGFVRTELDVSVGEDAEKVKSRLAQQIASIAQLAEWSAKDVAEHNNRLEPEIRQGVVARRARVKARRDLGAKLGFKLDTRADAPKPVPMQRQTLGIERRAAAPPQAERTFEQEWHLTEADYEEVIAVLRGALRACERSPDQLVSRAEESIRDFLLILLNGTFGGAATGETFVVDGKTDILVRVEDRHVFVGECKWWEGPAAFEKGIDQLLSYLPWRDEKAALIVFIKNKDATKAIEAADAAMQAHPAFKRVGTPSSEPTARRNYVLGHPDDADREITVAVLFAVIRKE